jgi:hypothetical protein
LAPVRDRKLEIDAVVQLDMTPDMKWWIFEEHDFYVAQINERVIAQFQDLNGDADRYAKAEYRRLSERPGRGDGDMAAVAEHAHDNAVEYYRMLADLKQSVILGALSGLYHQWEKQLRDFIEMELVHDMSRTEATKIAWSRDIANVFHFLGGIGWDVRAEAFFPLIDACRLVVNVYKHGQGNSLTELNSKYPEYLPDQLAKLVEIDGSSNPYHDWLSVSEDGFAKMAGGLRAFWEQFPERLKSVSN